jgi:acyl-coenzyme A thioesterase PaaI-like protein
MHDVHRQPNSRDCFVCGLENPFGLKLTFVDDGVGEVRCAYVIRPQFQGYPGIAHGGVVAAILDEVVGRVALIGDPNHFMMTVRMEITYRQPVPVDTPLTILGRPVRMGGRLTRAVGEVRLPDGSVAVEAALTLVDVPERMRADGALDALGWKVYP